MTFAYALKENINAAFNGSVGMATRKAAQSTKTKKSKPAAAKRLKDPAGGLTAAGRAHFAETEGAHLKPGVKKVKTTEDLKRKGSFLRRHYGKKNPSPLVDEHGEPTRYAKQAHAWGEPVPKTLAAVKKLAEKGTKLLERYHKEADGKKDASPRKKSRPK